MNDLRALQFLYLLVLVSVSDTGMFAWVVRLWCKPALKEYVFEPSQLVQFLLIRKCTKCQEAPRDDAFSHYRFVEFCKAEIN